MHGSQIKWVRLALDMTLMSNSISLTCVPSGYYLCSASTAATAIAGAVYGTVSSVAVTLLSCCIIGKPRTIRVREHGLQESVSGYIRIGCFGNRAQINTTAQRYYRDSFFSGSQTENSSGDYILALMALACTGALFLGVALASSPAVRAREVLLFLIRTVWGLDFIFSKRIDQQNRHCWELGKSTVNSVRRRWIECLIERWQRDRQAAPAKQDRSNSS